MQRQQQVQVQRPTTRYLEDGEHRLSYAVKQINDLPEPNRTYAKDYQRHLELKPHKSANAQARTIGRRLHELRDVLLLLGKDARQAEIRDIEELVLKLKRRNMAAKSRVMTELTLKNFYAFLYGMKKKHSYPEIVDWIEMEPTPPTKTADLLLTMPEMQALIGACMSARDRCIISIFATFGCRVGEVLNLAVKDISITDKETNWIKFDGKTGERQCPWTSQSLCAPYITAYLNEYRPKDPDAPLFLTPYGEPLDYKNIRKLLGDSEKAHRLKEASAQPSVPVQRRNGMERGSHRFFAKTVHGLDSGQSLS